MNLKRAGNLLTTWLFKRLIWFYQQLMKKSILLYHELEIINPLFYKHRFSGREHLDH